MGINFILHATKRTAIQFSTSRRLLANSAVGNIQQFCRSPPTFSSSATSRAPHVSVYRRWFSSSPSAPSSDRKMGLLSWYLRMIVVHPILTKSVSSCLIYGAADLTAQMITMPISGSLDLVRTIRIAGFGLLILGPVQHVWFNFIGKILPKRDTITTLKKLILGQVSYGPAITATFFSYNAALQGESGDEIASRLKRDLFPTIISGLMYWPVCDFFTYKVVPVHLQPLMNSSFSYLWTIYLTYMASLEKAVAE